MKFFRKNFSKKVAAECSLKSFFQSNLFVKTMERSTDEEETKMATAAPPNQTMKFS